MTGQAGPLSYEASGAGRPLLLLHPFPFDRRCWRAVAGHLGGQVRTIRPDLRGFGGSPLERAGESSFSIADLADDVVALLDGLGLARAAVCGLSMGGYVALALAARHPHRLEALVLADTKAGPDASEARKARDEAIALVAREGLAPFADALLPRLLSPRASAALRAEAAALVLDQSPAAVRSALAALRDRPDRRPELAAVRCPTLVLVGSDDAVTPPAEARALADGIPGAALVELPGAGHLTNLEAPEAFAAALLRFL